MRNIVEKMKCCVCFSWNSVNQHKSWKPENVFQTKYFSHRRTVPRDSSKKKTSKFRENYKREFYLQNFVKITKIKFNRRNFAKEFYRRNVNYELSTKVYLVCSQYIRCWVSSSMTWCWIRASIISRTSRS